MYADIFLFIIAFSVFSLYAPQQPPVVSASQTLLICLLVMAGLYLFCRAVFKRCARDGAGCSAVRYAKALSAAKTGALCAYVALVLIVDFKQTLPAPIHRSELALNTCGIAVFIALLLIVWLCAFCTYRMSCDPRSTRGAFILWHVRISAALVLPWLFFSAFMDGLSLLPAAVYERVSGNPVMSGVLVALVIGAAALVFPWVLVRLWGCSPLPPGPVRDRIEQVCRSARVRCSGIYLWNLFGGHMLSAGIMGFVPALRYLLISPALLDMLEPDELEAVIAHEAGHIRHRHMLFYLVFILGYGFLCATFYSLFFPVLHTSDLFLDLTLRPDGTFSFRYHIVTLAVVIGFFLLYFRFLFGFFSRSFERQADCAALALTGTSRGITGALEKIARVSAASRTAPDWHHYSIAERAGFLQACESSPGLSARHGRLVRAYVFGFCAALCMFGALLWINRQNLTERDARYVLLFIEKMSQRRPDDAVLRFQLAGLYYEKKLFSAAEKEYRWAIELRPDFYDSYNNLAWLYATCEEPGLRNYPEALRLASIAVSLAPHAYILDTLAECLYVNGRYLQAVIAAEEALRAAEPENRAHYEEQLLKFRAALDVLESPTHSGGSGTIAL